jgi:hypothetical protein
MDDTDLHTHRIHHLKGSPFKIGYATGQSLGPRLEANIERYVRERVPTDGVFDAERWRTGALSWLHNLPGRFLEEFEGLAHGAKLPLQRVAEWAHLEVMLATGCTGAIVTLGNRAWVARNNDFYVPDLWGYVTIKEVAGRIPAISFGMEGDVFTPTGINRELLWLHYNWLPAPDAPAAAKPHLPCYALLVEALEVCRTLQEVETLLGGIERDGGMLLFAVDGKTEAYALYECTCTDFHKREADNGWLVGANHYCTQPKAPPLGGPEALSSASRYDRMGTLVRDLASSVGYASPVNELIGILADDGIEARGDDPMTVYSNVACPSAREVWYTFGGIPAASRGYWQRLSWPW